MTGVQNRMEREDYMQSNLAWTTAAFTRQDKLKELSQYLRPKVTVQSGSEVLAILRGMQAAGAPMNIRKMN